MNEIGCVEEVWEGEQLEDEMAGVGVGVNASSELWIELVIDVSVTNEIV